MGLLIRDKLVDVPGLTIIPPATHGGPSWAVLDVGDYRMRHTSWVRQVILHTTKGAPKQYVRAGAGQSGAARNVADFWHRDPTHSAAHLVIDRDGTVLCLADLALHCCYQATVSNDWSVGIELYQESDGGLHEAVFDAAAKLVPAICGALGIPFQIHAARYTGHPLQRMLNGGPDCVGVLAHRDNTEQRGWGDPGDEVIHRLVSAGAEPLDYGKGEDLERGKARQAWLNAHGGHLVVDGLVGPASLAEARRQGLAWRDAPTG